MKTTIYLALVVIFVVFNTCSSDDLPHDAISFNEINKSITIQNSDSIEGNCKALIFEISKFGHDNFTALIRLNADIIPCDGFNNILANPTTKKVEIINDNQEIFEDSYWASANGISLEDFAGKGEKYIGYRMGFYPLSSGRYNYGWIKIELSADQQALKIISRATNYSENRPIFAGKH